MLFIIIFITELYIIHYFLIITLEYVMMYNCPAVTHVAQARPRGGREKPYARESRCEGRRTPDPVHRA